MVARRPQKTIIEALPIRTMTRATPAILILLCVTLMAIHRFDTTPVEKLRTAVTDVMAPVLSAVSKPFSALSDAFQGPATARALKAENIRLTEENAKLRQWYETALRLQAENQSFRELLNVKADPGLSFVSARVIADPGGAFVKSALLPIGSDDKIVKGNAVLSGQGLIGRITETGRSSARVLLITDLNSRIPVIIQNTRTKAILAGRNEEFMKLERLPVDSGIAVGQRIVTSGDGGQLPADIPVGVISEVGPHGIWVRPIADVDRAAYVQVINAEMDESLVTGDIAP